MPPRAAPLVLTALVTASCVVSFDGYDLAKDGGTGAIAGTGNTSSGGVGASGGTTGGGAGGTAGSGASGATGGTNTGATGGTNTGATGGTGASGGTGGIAGATGGSGASGGSDGGTGATGGATGCPSVTGTTPMIQVPNPNGGTFCIDATEVSQGQYAAFLGTPKNSNHPACIGKTNFNSTCFVAGAPNKPILCIDWCDAYAYCDFIGKRLCGKLGGGGLPTSGTSDKTQSQWYAACSKGGTQPYPYGPVFDETACNGGTNPTWIGMQNVGTIFSCVGGYPGIYDMSGNAEEWEDACTGQGATDSCAVRGGNRTDPNGPELACTAAKIVTRTQNSDLRGFRCCAG